MVKELNLIPTDLTGVSGYTGVFGSRVYRDTITSVQDNRWVTHKRVSIDLCEVFPHSAEGPESSYTVSLSPLRAMALVKRLLAVLDELAREGVELPQLHSRLMDEYNEVVDISLLSGEWDSFKESYSSSVVVKDGEMLRNILPASITK